MTRPKIKIAMDRMDVMMEALGVVAVLLLLTYPGYHYGDLPDIIPTHFNRSGAPDAFSAKRSIWALPVIGLSTYFSMLILTRFPHKFNFPKKITKENAERQYRLAVKMMRTINLVVIIVFCYLTYQTVEISLGNAQGLGNGFTITFLIGIFTPIVAYVVLAFKKPTKAASASIDSE